MQCTNSATFSSWMFHDQTSKSSKHGVVSSREKIRCRPIQTVIQRPHKLCKLRLFSLNVGTMRGRANEVVETLGRRNIDICCIQESRWKGCSVRLIKAKDFTYKFIWSGDSSGFGGAGILIEFSPTPVDGETQTLNGQ